MVEFPRWAMLSSSVSLGDRAKSGPERTMSRLQAQFNQVPPGPRCQCSKPFCGHPRRCADNARWVRPTGERLCDHCGRMWLGGGVDPGEHYESLEAK